MSDNEKQGLWKRLAMLAAVVAALVAAWQYLPVTEWMRNVIDYVDSLGFWGAFAYSVVYVVCALVGVPRTALNVGAGIVFSYPVAVAVVLSSALVAYMCTFQIGRRWAGDWVRRKIRSTSKGEATLNMVKEEQFKMIFLVRLNPFVPGVIKGYGFGATEVSFKTYLVASILGFLPIALAHVYLGWAGGEAMMHSGQQPESFQWGFLIGGVVVSIFLIIAVSWYGYRAVKKHAYNDK